MRSNFFKSKFRPFFVPLLTCTFFLCLYQVSIWGGLLPPSNGVTQFESNVIKAQRYVYQNQSDSMVLVGSSLTDNIKPEYIVSNVTNLAMAGGASQTGLEVIKKRAVKPSTLLVELNYTIDRKVDAKLVDSLYDPVLYLSRLAFPMFREEYRPVSILVYYLKNRSKQQDKDKINNSELTEKEIGRLVEEGNKPLSEKREKTIRSEAEYIKNQLAELKQQGWRIVLFDVPGEERVQNTKMYQQSRSLMRSLFPKDSFEWLPEPPSKNWITSDGVHLVRSDAEEYALFLREQLLKKNS